jgi:hypothetical protein
MPIHKAAPGIWLAALVASSAIAGAWGIGSFDNDDASDWIAELEQADSPGILAATLRGIDSKSNYVEASDCAIVLAAAEVVAAAHGKPSKALPAEAAAWLKRVRPTIGPDLLPQARAAVSFCRDNANSELRQLWMDSKDLRGWLADTANLLSRLQ